MSFHFRNELGPVTEIEAEEKWTEMSQVLEKIAKTPTAFSINLNKRKGSFVISVVTEIKLQQTERIQLENVTVEYHHRKVTIRMQSEKPLTEHEQRTRTETLPIGWSGFYSETPEAGFSISSTKDQRRDQIDKNRQYGKSERSHLSVTR